MNAKVFSPLMVGCMVLFGLTAAAQDMPGLNSAAGRWWKGIAPAVTPSI
jgi:hypothetical protein